MKINSILCLLSFYKTSVIFNFHKYEVKNNMRLILIFTVIIAMAGTLLYLTESYEQKITEDAEAIALIQRNIEEKRNRKLTFYKNNLTIDSVDLSNLSLDDIPFDILKKMPNLKYLNLANNQITSINDDLGNLLSLEYLDISNNLINVISNQNIYEKRNLKHLIAAHNKIPDLSIFFIFDNLETIDLSNNGLSTAYFLEKNRLPKLKKINLSNNSITGINGFNDLKDLTIFKISNNQLTIIPIFENCPKLSYLDLSNNEINYFRIDNYDNSKDSNIKTLLLSNNNIEFLEFTKYFQKVEHLDLSQNQLQGFGELSYFKNLNYLNLSNNNFHFQFGFTDDRALIDSLDLSHNRLKKIRWESEVLRYLNLSNNDLTVEETVLETNQLQDLNISNCEIKYPNRFVNNVLSNFPNLKRINVSNTAVCKDGFDQNDFEIKIKNTKIICD